jgi:hypothetical protein
MVESMFVRTPRIGAAEIYLGASDLDLNEHDPPLDKGLTWVDQTQHKAVAYVLVFHI